MHFATLEWQELYVFFSNITSNLPTCCKCENNFLVELQVRVDALVDAKVSTPVLLVRSFENVKPENGV